jgi:uncharacterized protein YecT (DUF1311 family)
MKFLWPNSIQPRSVLFLFAALVLVVISINVMAQQPASPPQNPAASQADAAPPPPGPPPPAAFKDTIPADQLAFLSGYDGKAPKEIIKDKRFRQLEKQITPSTRYFYHYDRGLTDTRDEVLDNQPLPITVRDGRYVMVSSTGGADSHMFGRGFLWFDMQAGIGIGGVYFHPTNGEPTPTLTIFSKQLTDTALSAGQLPSAFVDDLDEWAGAARVRPISPRYFIPTNGKKYVLVHDEDYCFHPDNAPQPSGCDQMNADAADADMNAAYFMQETHNAADANAWMLDPDQIAWLAVRDRTCGANGLACRIEITRRRTAVLIGHPMPPPRVAHR